MHTLKTIIECKRWKEKVDRQVIDTLFASVEDLNANKGAIFTTKGYEEGAIQYAKNKNIDIFIVRDLNEDEWGKPGRFISLYVQYFHSMLSGFMFENPKFFSPSGQPLKNTSLNLSVQFTKEQQYPEHLKLYSLNEPEPKEGPNFVKLLINIRNHILRVWSQQKNILLKPESEMPQQAFERRVKLNFLNYPFKFFKHDSGYITFSSISFSHHESLTQQKMEFDRAASIDFALVVENYITNQRNFAIKSKEDEQLNLSEPIESSKEISNQQTLKNGSIIKITLEHYVSYELQPTAKITKMPDVTVNLQVKPKA